MKGLEWLRARATSPSAFLTGVNIIAAALGFAQSLLVASLLGPAAFGVIGVLVATSGVVANFLDLRVSDLTTKLYYRAPDQEHPDPDRYRQSLLQVCLMGSLLVSTGMFVIGLALNLFLAPRLLEASTELAWMVSAAISGGLLFSSNTAFFLQRLSERFMSIGVGRLVTQLCVTSAMVANVLLDRSLYGYFRGLLMGAVLGVVINYGLAIRLFRQQGMRLLAGGWRTALPDYKLNVRLLIGTNSFGYTKMFHRAGDVLLMGALAGDAVTGIYKLARSIADALNLVFDALNQVHFPGFLRLLTVDDLSEYHRRAAIMVRRGLIWTPALMLLTLLLLPFFVDRVLGSGFESLPQTAAVLMAAFGVTVGVHLWLWPLVIHQDVVGRFVAFSAAGVVVQYATTCVLSLLMTPAPIFGAVGFVAYYVVTYGCCVTFLRRRYGDKVPRLSLRRALQPSTRGVDERPSAQRGPVRPP